MDNWLGSGSSLVKRVGHLVSGLKWMVSGWIGYTYWVSGWVDGLKCECVCVCGLVGVD